MKRSLFVLITAFVFLILLLVTVAVHEYGVGNDRFVLVRTYNKDREMFLDKATIRKAEGYYTCWIEERRYGKELEGWRSISKEKPALKCRYYFAFKKDSTYKWMGFVYFLQDNTSETNLQSFEDAPEWQSVHNAVIDDIYTVVIKEIREKYTEDFK